MVVCDIILRCRPSAAAAVCPTREDYGDAFFSTISPQPSSPAPVVLNSFGMSHNTATPLSNSRFSATIQLFHRLRRVMRMQNIFSRGAGRILNKGTPP